jgi:hypothetical protein
MEAGSQPHLLQTHTSVKVFMRKKRGTVTLHIHLQVPPTWHILLTHLIRLFIIYFFFSPEAILAARQTLTIQGMFQDAFPGILPS